MILDKIPVRLRLSLGHAVWMILLFSAVGYGLFQFVRAQLLDSVDAALLASATSIRDVRQVKNRRQLDSYLEEFFGDRMIRPYAQLVNLSGKVSAKTANVQVRLPITESSINRAEKGMETFETFNIEGKLLIRQVTLPVFFKNVFTGELIQIAAPLDNTIRTLRGISFMLWTTLPGGLLLSIVFGYILTARAFKPVTDMRKAAAKLSVEDLSARLSVPTAKDELQELAISYNAMLDRLEDAISRLRRFVGDVSHELRTPLAVIRGEAELALRRTREPESYQDSLSRVVREGHHMTSIIEDLLLLARAESHSVAMNWLEVGLEQFTEDLRASIQPIFDTRKVSLSIFIDEDCKFRIAPTYLSLAIKNVLLNAAKHSPSDSTVEFKVTRDKENLCFQVKDSGEGIPKESVAFIFDPFFRVDSARNRSSGGTGIGLALAAALVKLHKGSITVESEPGRGSTFRIQIPFIAGSTSDSETVS